MWDVENRKYLDFTAGIAVNALGHCDAGVAAVIAEQVSWVPPMEVDRSADFGRTGKATHAYLKPLS